MDTSTLLTHPPPPLSSSSGDPLTIASATSGLRLSASLALCSAFGLALGARAGGVSMLTSGALAPLCAVAPFLVASAPLYIVLSLADVPLDAAAIGRAVSRGVISTSMVLGGLSPLVLLFGVSGETGVAGAVVGWLSLVVALAIGTEASAGELAREAHRVPSVVLVVLVLFVATLALRLASGMLPALTGGAS